MTALRPDCSDQEILAYIFARLDDRLGTIKPGDTEGLLRVLPTLPPGLRAMAATHELDVSVTEESLEGHFFNWPELTWAEETVRGLREVGADDAAAVFSQALEAVGRRWTEFTGHLSDSAFDFHSWCDASGLTTELDPLDEQLWKLLSPETNGLHQLWLAYARKHPERLS